MWSQVTGHWFIQVLISTTYRETYKHATLDAPKNWSMSKGGLCTDVYLSNNNEISDRSLPTCSIRRHILMDNQGSQYYSEIDHRQTAQNVAKHGLK